MADENTFEFPRDTSVLFKCSCKDYSKRTKPEFAKETYRIDGITFKGAIVCRDKVPMLCIWRSKVKFDLTIEVDYTVVNEGEHEPKCQGKHTMIFKEDEREVNQEMPTDYGQFRVMVATFGLIIPLTCQIRISHRGEATGEEPAIDCDESPEVSTGIGGSSALNTYASMDMYHTSLGPTFLSSYDGMAGAKQKFAGLVNKGATCYMNSMLQTLYHISKLRKAVYRIPVHANEERREDAGKEIAFALQDLFYQMQTSNVNAVNTDNLISSFGWTTADAFQQHDVQEFCRLLMDSLEDMMRGSPVDGTISNLFKGEAETYVDCIHVDYKSTKKDSFEDIQLQVKGCRNIYESFQDYIRPEKLDGQNQYLAEGHGKQDANKGVRFTKLPPVLLCQLKRFEWDPVYGSQRKVNDTFEFFEEIDLNPFVYLPNGLAPEPMAIDHEFKTLEETGYGGAPMDEDENADVEDNDVKMEDQDTQSSSNEDLFAIEPRTKRTRDDSDKVMTERDGEGYDIFPQTPDSHLRSGSKRSHSEANGYANGYTNGDEGYGDLDRVVKNSVYSHYGPDGPYRYNLHSVLVHSGSTYGGHYKAYIRPEGKGSWYSFNDETSREVEEKHALAGNFGGTYQRQSAYMLVYVQTGQLGELCAEMRDEDIPEDLKGQIELQIKEREETERLREEEKRKVDVRFLFMGDSVAKYHLGGVGDEQLMKKRRMHRPHSEMDILTFIEQSFELHRENIIVFHYTSRKNYTYRPNKPIFYKENYAFKDDKRSTFFVATEDDIFHVSPRFNIKEACNPEAKVWKNEVNGDFRFLIVKYFDPPNSSLNILGGAIVHKEEPFLQDLARTIWQLINYDSNDGELQFIEEEQFEENKTNDLADYYKTVEDFGLIHGDILIVQFVPHNATQTRHCDETKRYLEYIQNTFECRFSCINVRQWMYIHTEHMGLNIEDVPKNRRFVGRIEKDPKLDGLRKYLGGKFGIDKVYWNEILIWKVERPLYSQSRPRTTQLTSYSTVPSDIIEISWMLVPYGEQSNDAISVCFIAMPELDHAFEPIRFQLSLRVGDNPNEFAKRCLEILRHPIYGLHDRNYDFNLVTMDNTVWFNQPKYLSDMLKPLSETTSTMDGSVFVFVKQPQRCVEEMDDMKVKVDAEEDGDIQMTDTSSHSSGSNTDSGGSAGLAGSEDENEVMMPKHGLFFFDSKMESIGCPIPFLLAGKNKTLSEYLNDVRDEIDEGSLPSIDSLNFKVVVKFESEEIHLDDDVRQKFRKLMLEAVNPPSPLFIQIYVSAKSGGSKRQFSSFASTEMYHRPLKIRKTNKGEKKPVM